jgi:hypothetical protein
MPDLNTMRTNLQSMRLQLLPMMDALYKGMPEKREEREKRLSVLESVQSRLDVLVRDVKNAQHLQDARASGIHNIPRDLRYGAAQALQQKQRDLEAFRKEADDLAEVLRRLLDANGLLSPAQGTMKIGELAEKMVKAAEQSVGKTGVPPGSGPEIGLPHADGPGLSGAVNVVIFIALAIQKLRANAKEKKEKEEKEDGARKK